MYYNIFSGFAITQFFQNLLKQGFMPKSRTSTDVLFSCIKDADKGEDNGISISNDRERCGNQFEIR